MRHAIVALLLLATPLTALASGAEPELEPSRINLRDKASLQRGAAYFVNYCQGCHSLSYMRYNRMAADLGIPESELRGKLIFSDARPGDPMVSSMRPEDGLKWFGLAVPDLTLVTRWRSPDWVYTYLKSFYIDDTRPWGVNNLLFPAVGMPNPFTHLQGVQEAVMSGGHGEGAKPHITGLKLVQPGSLSSEEFDSMVRDLTNFLTYVGEPMKLERQRLGIYVLLFLGLMFIVAYLLKKEYWKDVH